jgi:hypothetical protein
LPSGAVIRTLIVDLRRVVCDRKGDLWASSTDRVPDGPLGPHLLIQGWVVDSEGFPANGDDRNCAGLRHERDVDDLACRGCLADAEFRGPSTRLMKASFLAP